MSVIDDLFVKNKKQAEALAKAKLPISKKLEKKILSYAVGKRSIEVKTIQKYRGKILERTWSVRKYRGVQEMQEIERRLEGAGYVVFRNVYCTMCGYKVAWYNSNIPYYRFNMHDYGIWDYCEKHYCNIWCKHLFTDKDIIELDPNLKYYSYNSNSSIPLIDYITIYRAFPKCEILMKLGFGTLCKNSKILKQLEDKNFIKFLWKNKKCHCYYNGTMVMSAYKSGLSIEEKNAIDRFNSRISGFAVLHSDFIEVVSKDRLRKYIVDKGIDIGTYFDLISAIKYLHLDLTDTKNIFPKDFGYWHNYYTNQVECMKNKETDEKMKVVADKYLKLAKKSYEDICLMIPHSSMELIVEGEKLHHCVGRMGYNRKMANGTSLIIFVRKVEDKDTPFLTLEYDPKAKKVLQFYGDHDKQPEDHYKDIIYNKWLPQVARIRF